MDAEKITMYRTLEDKSGVVQQLPTTVSSQVYDEVSGQTVAEQLAHVQEDITERGYDVKWNALLALGGDWTNAIQTALDNHIHVFFSNGVYDFTQVFVRNSKQKITFAENVYLKSSMALGNAEQGYFHISGEVLETQYVVTQTINELTSEIFVSPSDSLNFHEGDIIEIQQDRPRTQSSLVETEEEHRQQHAYAILKVYQVDNAIGKIKVYEQIPYEFKLEYNPYIRKVDAIEDVVITGNNTQFDKMGVLVRGNFFHFRYAYNPDIRSFHCFNGAGKAVEMQNVNRFYIDDITYSKPSTTSIPFGESIMINKSGFGKIDNCYIYHSRRGIDFSNAWFCEVNDSDAMKARFTTHGLYSRFITFNNCTVYGDSLSNNNFYGFTFGNTSYMFDEHITLNHCKIYGGFYGVEAIQKTDHIVLNNCEFYHNEMAITLTNVGSMQINNCVFEKCSNIAGIRNTKKVVFESTKINAPKFVSTSQGIIRVDGDTGEVIFNNLKVLANRTNIFTFTVTSPTKIKIKNSEFENLNIDGQLYLGDNIDGVELSNVETNNRVRMNGQKNLIIQTSKIASCYYGVGTAPTKNCIVKDNIFTRSNGTLGLSTDAENNIHVERNIYLSTI